MRWKPAAVVATVAMTLLAGISLAQPPGLERARRTPAACAHPRSLARQIALSHPAVAQHARRSCGAGKRRLRGIAKRIAVDIPQARRAPDPSAGAGGAPVANVVASPEVPTSPTPPPPPEEEEEEEEDTTPPQTSILSGPASPTTATSASFVFSSSEPGSSFECKLDTGAWGPCTSPNSLLSVALGAHKFSVRAIDPAGNDDPTPAARSWTVEEEESPPPPDTMPPETSIANGPPASTTSTSASLSFSSSEAGSTFECTLDTGAWTACTSPQTYTGLGEGSHEFSVRATDSAQNLDPTPATRGWLIQAPPPPPPPPPPPAECSTVVASTAAAASAVEDAAAGSVVCLADGSYGPVSLSASKSAEVTLQAEHPGRATIVGATLDGSHLTLARFDITDEVTIEPASEAMTVEYNRITGGYMGINAGPTTSTSISDTTIRGNQLIGPFGEDALRINRYHDSGDPDPYGILIEGNEITGVRENGNHSDCLQSVWGGDGLYFRRNYLHDNRCQGFFVKDQPDTIVGITAEDNLLVRNNEPCAPEAPECGQPAYFQVFGPYQDFTMRRNTIWQGEVVATFQEGTGPGTSFESNVVNRFWTNTDLSTISYVNNTRCKRESSGGSWPAQTPGETVNCAPAFNDPTADDFRLIGSERGVDWAPAEEHYGP